MSLKNANNCWQLSSANLSLPSPLYVLKWSCCCRIARIHRARCLSSKKPGPIVWSDPSVCVGFAKAKYEHIHHPFPTFRFQKQQFLCFVFWTRVEICKRVASPALQMPIVVSLLKYELRIFWWTLVLLLTFLSNWYFLDGKQRKARTATCICRYPSMHMCQNHLVERLTQVACFDGFSMPKGHTIIESLWSSFEQKVGVDSCLRNPPNLIAYCLSCVPKLLK